MQMKPDDPNGLGPKVNLSHLLAKLKESASGSSPPAKENNTNNVDSFKLSSAGDPHNQNFGGFMSPFRVDPGSLKNFN